MDTFTLKIILSALCLTIQSFLGIDPGVHFILKCFKCICVASRRQELRELRLLQKEEKRAQLQLTNKLQQQREQIHRRFEQETTVSHTHRSYFERDDDSLAFVFNVMEKRLIFTFS